MSKTIQHTKAYVILLLISFLALSCTLPLAKGGTGTLSLSCGKTMSKAMFEPVLEIASYSLSGTGPDHKTIEATWSTEAGYTIEDIAAGSWEITISGLNEGGIVLARKTVSVEIVAGETTTASIILLPLETGSGSLALAVNWNDQPSKPTAPRLVARYQAAFNEDLHGTLDLSITGNTAAGTASLDAGYYTLSAALFDGSDIAYTWNVQAFRIVPGLATTAELACTSTSSDNESALDFNLSEKSVLTLDFNDSDTIKVRLNNVAPGTLYLGKANVSASAVSGSSTGRADVSGLQKALSQKDRSINGPIKRFDNERAQTFTPPANARAKQPLQRQETIHFGEDDQNLIVGVSTRAFWVESSTGDWIQQTARLRAKSATAYLWVPDSNFSNASSLTNDNKITQSQIDALDDSFNGSGPTSGDGIRSLVSTIFSTEYGGESGGNGGIDGDQHIHILLYDIDFDYASNQTGGTLGYFWGKDEYSDALMQTYGYRSNEAEIFYLDAHFTDLAPMMMVSVLAHEYQHMIHFNQKELLRNVSSPVWFNEMCSLVSEDFVGTLMGIPDNDSPRSRVPLFNTSYYESGVTDWLSGSNVLKSYASAYVFGAYLARNFGGAELFHTMLCRNEVGTDAISASLTDLGKGDSFANAFKPYMTAFVFDSPAPANAYSFPEKVMNYNGIQYTLPGFALQDYGNGPSLLEPDQQIGLRPYGNSIHSTSGWEDPEESTVITIDKPSDPNVSLYLMFVGR